MARSLIRMFRFVTLVRHRTELIPKFDDIVKMEPAEHTAESGLTSTVGRSTRCARVSRARRHGHASIDEHCARFWWCGVPVCRCHGPCFVYWRLLSRTHRASHDGALRECRILAGGGRRRRSQSRRRKATPKSRLRRGEFRSAVCWRRERVKPPRRKRGPD